MKYILSFLLAGLFSFQLVDAQQIYGTKKGTISFFSSTSVEDIDAKSTTAEMLMNIDVFQIAFRVKQTSFVFPKSLMQEHYNENYMESEKYPWASFKGSMVAINGEKIDLHKDGTYQMNVVGKMNMHGVDKDFKAPITLVVKAGTIHGTAKFRIYMADFKVEKPSVLSATLADFVDVTVDCLMTVTPKK
jgi:polyisoprenoid-binding protein YceI